MAHHKLLLEHAATGPGWTPTCSCGWIGIPRERKTAEGEYRAHKRAADAGRVHSDDIAKRALTPLDDLPEELRSAHPDYIAAEFDRAVDEVVKRINQSV